MGKTYKVFISSTYLDSVERRQVVADAVKRAGMLPVGMEHFSATTTPVVAECLQQVRDTDLLVGIIAHRYGWIPPGRKQSITEREYHEASKPLMFVIGDDVPVVPARDFDQDPDKWAKQEKLEAFKAKIDHAAQSPARFTEKTLGVQVLQALHRWRAEQEDDVDDSDRPTGRRRSSARDARRLTELATYLTRLADETRWVDLLGVSARGQATRVPLDEIYVRLHARPPVLDKRARRQEVLREAEPVHLTDVLRTRPFTVLIGEPGAGKTTFLRFLAHHLTGALRKETGYRARLGLDDDVPLPLPVLVPLKSLAVFLPEPGAAVFGTTLGKALDAWAEKDDRALPEGFLAKELRAGRLALLLDGLDEIPDDGRRAIVTEAVQKAAAAMRHGRTRGVVVLTSRPGAYSGRARLTTPFFEGRILDLTAEDVHRFTDRWIRAAYRVPQDATLTDFPEAREELTGLQSALTKSRTIREMSRSPVLLTVLALVHHTRKRLPEQRAVLYDQAVDVILRRFKDHPRWPVRAVREHLAAVAWRFMEAGDPAAVREEEERCEVVDVIARRIAHLPSDTPPDEIPKDARQEAREFLAEQELQGGLLTCPDGHHSRFAHRTFQEFLAAWHVWGEGEPEIHAAFDHHLSEASWLETLRLAAGVLANQGSRPVGRLLKHLIGDPTTSIQERADGIAAAMVLLPDVEQFDVNAGILRPVQLEVAGLTELLQNPKTKLGTRIGLAEALGRVGDPRLTDEQRWVHVPAGPFIRGEKGSTTEVDVPEFWIHRWPVTVGEYGKFMEEADPYEDPACWDARGWAWRSSKEVTAPAEWDGALSRASNNPVSGVSWWEARAYCRWATTVRGASTDLVRLPTTEESEKAARGGRVLTAERRNPNPTRDFPWGNRFTPTRANTQEAGVGATTPVGCFPSGHGPYGAWDQAGNVWEWCEGQLASESRVVRGGSWGNAARYARSAFRGRIEPGNRGNGLGFRPARSVTAD